MELRLENKVSLVCAASEGLGKASAIELAKEGSTVAICSRSMEKLLMAKEDIHKKTGAEVKIFQADLTKHEQIIELHNQVSKTLGDIEVLVNNVGGPPPGTFETLKDEDWQSAINLTMMSVLRMSKLVLPSMKEKKWGRIINISSVSVKTPVNNLFLSNSIRLGVLGWAKALSDEVGKDGITVNTVCRGSTRTNRITSYFQKQLNKQVKLLSKLKKCLLKAFRLKE